MANRRAEQRRKKPGPPSKQRSWFLPTVVAVVAVGLAGVAVVALTRETSEAAGPRVGDHWHMAYGVYDCDGYVAPSLQQTDPLGIHTHADGLIHVHPSRTQATGDRARMGLFIDAIGAELTDDRYVPGAGEAEGRVLSEADGCDGQPAELVLAYWPEATGDDDPQLIRSDLRNFRLHTDGSAIAIALVPEGTTTIPRPPLGTLQNPIDH